MNDQFASRPITMETTSGSSWSCVPNEDDEPLRGIVFVQHLAGSVAWTGLGARVLVHFVVVLVIPGDSLVLTVVIVVVVALVTFVLAWVRLGDLVAAVALPDEVVTAAVSACSCRINKTFKCWSEMPQGKFKYPIEDVCVPSIDLKLEKT